MADTSQMEVPPQTNGLSDGMDDDERLKMRPADIDADVKEMERRKRVDMIMNSKLFREELERIIETQLKDGAGTSGLMQQISDMMGVSKNAGHVFKNSNCVVPINDIRGIEAMGYAKGEKILRCKLAAVYRLIDLYGWSQGCRTLITARLNQDEEHFLVNPYGMLFHEITASSLIKVDMQGNVVEQGTTNFSVNITAFSLHAAIHSSRPDIKCIIHVHTPSVVAISALKCGLLPLSEESVVIGDISTHSHPGGVLSIEEIEKIARNLGPNNKILLLTNQGAVCCGETIEEAFFTARNTVLACESQLKLMPMGIDNLVLISDEQRKKLYEAAHKAPESSPRPDQPSILEGKVERKWRVGGIEFEALMRMLDNAGFRTGYIYRHPLVKGEPPKPRNDVEVPPAVSSLGYLLEEEELYRQGLWKKLEGGRKGHDRTRWLNSPNVYQKVEILETGTPDPKKITKWVADGSPTHSSTPVKIENALQFVPKNTNPKEFKQLQQQIKDYRRADKISAGPQSHILEGVTWEEAKKMQDATVTQTGDQVVLMGAASKGIIQRGFQHNATMYKSPYAKNPFDSITDEELDEYKRVVERKARGEFDDTTDYSESEGLSSAQINKRISDIRSPTSVTSETEEESRDEPQVLRIETTQAPKPSQPEIVMSDDDVFLDNAQEIIVEHFKVSAVEQSPVSRVSVNSTRSMKVVRAYRHPTSIRNYYRTTSFSGLPKGSYLLPNPRHFHLAHYTNINKPMRPHFINLISGGRYSSFNPNLPHHISNNWDNNIRPTVTINLTNSRTITLNISLQTLREFIYPFATALNLSNLTDSKTASCQTSYHVDQKVSITEITNGNSKNMNRDTSSKSNTSSEEISEFESSILKTMRDSMLSEPNFNDIYTDFDSTQTIIDQKIVKNENEHFVIQASDLQAIKVTKNVSLGGGDTTETIYQTENDEVKAQSLMFDNNEDFTEFEGSGYEASGELTSTVSVLETNSTRIDDDQDLLTKHRLEEIPETNVKPSPNTEHLNINDVLGMADVVTDRILEMAQDYSLFEEVVKETLSLFKELPFPYDIHKVTDAHIAQKILEPKNEMRDQEINKNTNENIDLKFTHSEDERSFELESCVDSPNLDIGNLQYEIEPKESHVVESSQFESKSEFNENKQKSEAIQNGSNEVIEMHAIVTPHQYTTSINTDENILQAQTVDASNKHTLSCELARFPSIGIEETLKRKEYINITPKTAVLQDSISEIQASVRSHIENSTALKQLGFKVEENEETLMNTPLIVPCDKDNYRVHCNTDNLNINIEPAEINTENADEAIYIETCQNNVVKITPNVDDIPVGDQQTEKSCHMAPLECQIQFTIGALPVGEEVKENIDKHVTYEDEKYVQIENSQCKVIDNTKSIQQEVENDDLNFQEPLRKENVIPEITKDDLPIDNINTIECDEGFGATESEYDIKQDGEFLQFNIVENTQTKVPRDGTESTNTVVQDLTSTLIDENKVKETPLTSEIISSTDTFDTQNYLTADEESHELSKGKTGQIASEDSSDLEDYEIIEFDDDTNMENLSYVLDQIVQHEEDNKAEIMRLGSNMNEMNILENQQQVDDIIPALSENVVVGMDNFINEKNDAEGNVIQRKNIDIVSLNMVENIAEKHNIERNSSPPDSFDEGISDCKSAVTESTTANFSSEFDEKVIEMAEVVFEYIIKQCYEVTDLVLFPEVLYDENVIKMFLKLKELYVKYYSDISDADKNELRMNMTNYILKKLEHTSPACYEEGESSGNISDKLFTISEFISDIFDKFFDEYIDSNEFSDSWSGFSSLLAEKQVCHSTPEDKNSSENADVKKSKIKEKKNAKPTTPSKTSSKPEDLTAFQKKKSQSGSEVYWISINRSPKNEEDTTPRKAVVINVDDIPLKPPDDLTPSKNRNLKRPLSPILEEAKCNLLNEFQENALRPQSSVLSMHTENFEYKDTTDFLAGGDYVQFDKPESDMILVNEATFFRGHAANNAYYIQSSSVTFHPNLKQMKHNNNVEGCIGGDEGNWMGFETAKF